MLAAFQWLCIDFKIKTKILSVLYKVPHGQDPARLFGLIPRFSSLVGCGTRPQGPRRCCFLCGITLVHMPCPFNSHSSFRAQAGPLEAFHSTQCIKPWLSLQTPGPGFWSCTHYCVYCVRSGCSTGLHEGRDGICGLLPGTSPAPNTAASLSWALAKSLVDGRVQPKCVLNSLGRGCLGSARFSKG